MSKWESGRIIGVVSSRVIERERVKLNVRKWVRKGGCVV